MSPHLSGAKCHPIPFGRLSPKTRTQSQTQTQGKASRREREHPPRLLFQEAGCLSACHLFEGPASTHTHPPAVLNWPSQRHQPLFLALGTGTWPFVARFWPVCQRLPPVAPSSAHLGSSERDIVSLDTRTCLCGSGLVWSATRLGPARCCAPRCICPSCLPDRLSHVGRHRCQSNRLSRTD